MTYVVRLYLLYFLYEKKCLQKSMTCEGGSNMGRPVNKEELREAANVNFNRLLEMIENRTEEEKNTPYDF